MTDSNVAPEPTPEEVREYRLDAIDPENRALNHAEWLAHRSTTVAEGPDPGDLPERVIVDQHGHYWRDYGTYLSMPPVSEENVETTVRAVFDRPESRAEAWERGYAASSSPGDADLRAAAQALLDSLSYPAYTENRYPDYSEKAADALRAALTEEVTLEEER